MPAIPIQFLTPVDASSQVILLDELTPAQKRRFQLQAELERFVQIMIEKMNPERIILFGSYAADKVMEWSDLDIVVVAATEMPFYERLRQITRWVRPTVGIDALIYTPDEWTQLVATRRFVQEEIVGKGIVIHER